jgi:glycosyltransferase involved in cell wall biosynthesis
MSLNRKALSKAWIALLGRQDSPTDGVCDYVQFLARAIKGQGRNMDIVRVPWATEGILKSLYRLWQALREHQGRWVLVQYTALAWSRHGFPGLLLLLLWILRARKMRVAVVFHDPAPYHDLRLIDRWRRTYQRFVMRSAYRLADKSVLPVPLERAPWLPTDHSKAAFVPVGPNVPAGAVCRAPSNGQKLKSIAVFGVTGDGTVGNEIADIAYVAKTVAAHTRGIRLTTLGRGSKESESRLRQELAGGAVEFSAFGILSAEAVSKILTEADVSLFVRGPISTNRGSAIASIACGVPLVAYSQPRLPREFSDAGVLSVSMADREAMADATIKVLTDGDLWLEMHRRNRLAFETYFSWQAIASQFATILASDSSSPIAQ